MRKQEDQYSFCEDYFLPTYSFYSSIRDNIRGFMIQYLIDFMQKLGSYHETLHLCIDMLDRFLSHEFTILKQDL